jgi:hypothetical protein
LVHVIPLDDADIILPFFAQAVPGFDHVAVVIWQVILAIEHEGGGYELAGAGSCAASGVPAVVKPCGRNCTGLITIALISDDFSPIKA